MNKKMIISILSAVFGIGGIIVEFLESKDEEKDIQNMIDKAVEERLKNVEK